MVGQKAWVVYGNSLRGFWAFAFYYLFLDNLINFKMSLNNVKFVRFSSITALLFKDTVFFMEFLPVFSFIKRA